MILGGNAVKLTSSNVAWDEPTGLFTFDVTVENTWNRTIGTADGTTVVGLKAFYHEGPTVTSYKAPGDTGTVKVYLPDGHGNFSAGNQPYYAYPYILAPGQITPVHGWGFEVPPTVDTWSFSLFVVTRYVGEPDVPLVAPDSVPEVVYDTTRITWNDAVLGSPVFRNLVLISFHPWATAEDRMAAVNRTNGTVVGGRLLTPSDGLYVVRFNENGTTQALHQALDRLSVLPQVAFASPEYLMTDDALEHFRPEDGTVGWQRTDWSITPSTVGGGNWGMEAIWMPHAWSCTVGHPDVRLGIVDRDFHAHPDLNVSNGGWSSSSTDSHGLPVAAIAAAKGDNGGGIAGVSWKSELRYYHVDRNRTWVFFTFSDLANSIARAIQGGNRVINVSMGRGYRDDLGYQRRPTPADATSADEWGGRIADAIAAALPHGNDPLIVFSAGNYGGIDGGGNARLNGRDAILARHPTRVLVVGAAEHRPGNGDFDGDYAAALYNPGLSDMYQGTNYGFAVQIAAPGKENGTLVDGGYGRLNGTSLAAPAVAGAAVLLLSIDHRLTAAELKTLLLRGAEAGNIEISNRVNEIYLLNAHHSLRLAAARPGAGICGNPVWRDAGGMVHTRRGEDWQSGTSEALFTAPATGLSPQHRSMKVGFSGGAARRYDRGSWVQDTIAGPLENPSHLSRMGMSHEGDTTVTVTRRRPNDFEEWFDVAVNGVPLVSIPGPPVNYSPTQQHKCVTWGTSGTEFDSCYATRQVRPDFRTSSFSFAYSSARNEIMLAVARDSAAWKVEEGGFFYGGYMQRNYSYDNYVLDTHVYFIPVGNAAAYSTLVSSRGLRYNDVAYSADGRHVALRSAARTTTNWYTPAGDELNTSMSCAATFRRVEPNDLPLVFSTPLVTNTLVCYPGAVFAGGASWSP